MKKFKMIAAGLVVSVVFSSFAIVGVSAATPLSINSSIPITNSLDSVNSNAITIPNLSVISPDFNYGPDGGPNLATIINEGGVAQNGDVGLAVKQLQGYLNQIAGYDGYHIITQDGYFGNDTLAAVKAFQTWYDVVLKVAHQLYVDGIVGSQTYDAIIGVIYG
jgi:hypothetical protein